MDNIFLFTDSLCFNKTDAQQQKVRVMTGRKQGRHSAKTADETKLQILVTATKMFCKSGYERGKIQLEWNFFPPRMAVC
ncbi:hypothetical protein CSW98_06485 [Vibrio sp. HA2012]|nr:hypothetical protein CSW98_06485 [Vibrio sp. HA2012]